MHFYHLRTVLLALAALPTSHSSNASSLGLETSASPCSHFTLNNWKGTIRLPGEGLEFGNDAQMWIYMHHGDEDINDSLGFEVSHMSRLSPASENDSSI